MAWMSTNLATALVGALAGLIFFFDGWKRDPKELVAFSKSPRITGLVWVVGGGVISGFLTYVAKSDQSSAMVYYVVSFALIAIISLILGTTAMAVYYVAKNGSALGFSRSVIEAIPFTLSFLANGLDATLDRIAQTEKDRAALALNALDRSRLHALQFINDANGFISGDIKDSRTGAGQFKFFLANYLRAFVVMFFEESEVLEKYRAAFYMREQQALVFVVGADNQGSGNEFGAQPLELGSTLAGKAFTNNEIYFFPKDEKVGYKKLPIESRYKSFVVVPVPYKPGNLEAERIGVLSVDGLDENAPFQEEFRKRMLIYFSNVIARAHLAYLGPPTGGSAEQAKR